MSSKYSLEKISSTVSFIRENDPWGANPLMYLITGSMQNVLIDTGCGTGDLRSFVNEHLGECRRLTVINTHNHAEQTGANWRFSTTGKYGLAPEVNELCASSADPYYTKLEDTSFAWQVKTYKITKWLHHEEVVRLDSEREYELLALHTPGTIS
uniref:Metallo-beta-lactamase domain-containing protein n=1 Tax=Plectus sambesii TaxID=2011161 RepID=A0A914WN23_9BILA